MSEERETYPLDDPLISMVMDLRAMEMQLRGAMQLFIRQHSLSGDWELAANGRELVRRAPAPAGDQNQSAPR